MSIDLLNNILTHKLIQTTTEFTKKSPYYLLCYIGLPPINKHVELLACNITYVEETFQNANIDFATNIQETKLAIPILNPPTLHTY